MLKCEPCPGEAVPGHVLVVTIHGAMGTDDIATGGAKGASEKVMSMKATVLRTVTYHLQLDGTTIDIDTGSPASLLDRLDRSLAPPDR